jgi:hypothetical protein
MEIDLVEVQREQWRIKFSELQKELATCQRWIPWLKQHNCLVNKDYSPDTFESRLVAEMECFERSPIAFLVSNLTADGLKYVMTGAEAYYNSSGY